MKSQEIRSKFLEFYKSKNHAIVPSSPMVLKNDPTLMFVNAGMVPFKEYFLGQKKIVDARVADSQKCLRVSGKHNDLEEVGKDTYHHTLFEMLGNWSFGDYFKKEAISWAWELLTEVYKIDKDILYVTIFEGDEKEGLAKDTEAYDIWKQYIAEDRILLGNKKDNFWEMGAQGPCGPCSEIHIDIRSADEKAKVSGASLVNLDHPHVVEVWNLVFMQFNRKADGSLENLPKTHIDTGMGFERLCMALQGVQSNYDTDVFTPIIREIQTITGVKYEDSSVADDQTDIAIRVIADHVRAVAFSIADGQLPSNTGAGYVIRRILRRAIRYGFTFLNQKEPFIYKLVATLSDQMGDAFPEIKAQEQLARNVIKEEEQSFLKTLEQGLLLLDTMTANAGNKVISGKKVFELKDTYGFPEDLTALVLSEKGLDYNKEEYQEALKQQQNRGREATAIETDDWKVLIEDDEEEFIGYDTLTADVKLTRYRKVTTKKDGEQYQLVFNMTPFYPEGGGQVGDVGYIETANGDVVYVINTKKENNLIIHYTKNLPENLSEKFKAVVNKNARDLSASNHTATHLLHQALRTILGTHVEQKGSLVSPKHLRFDFSHFSKVTSDELQEIEDFVNARIRENLSLVEQRNIPMQQAIDQGAIALFGEKYGDAVRAIKFGQSVELCGGTHVPQTGDIWHFKIKSEGAVASGIRRIEAITNVAVGNYFEDVERNFTDIKQLFKNPKDVVKSVTNLQDENATLKKQVEQLLKEKAENLSGELRNQLQEINGVQFLATKVALDANGIKNLAFALGKDFKNLFLFFASSEKADKAMLTCYISKELAAERGYDAGKVVRELGKLIHGGGGGQNFFATAGGKNPGGIPKALEKAKEYIVS
ncbi:alanine--tRNA ligase [Tenacibaculum finnmarkense genomovar finnmarkense]|uniref:alanine--tRNA ligase n=1 Tax=Tenacibaculum finnmarkense TaxID=2781243 RepID=UPI001E444D15|nr:alanine--tRNA ligase [Tenacibaculum finnmarkense]MCD8416498.1 alanine--tRNA ligase [Tenacibaculum finnmarkense genomovar finnmarkense]MCG8185301.1 alanine--tRNA ligase [Tenacibaculum finnmarkense genomovar finnmarkense]MCG8201432.1 alanine--tRNA ligase [Tenacibaculum finnmarkense genomovar finnmarkense]MCG8209197.1 alanine--tRNA ligase [Tenacibaculum finnmarkense genomovar finnmarkense]MCG8211992.1 alanine--tRNA ligase [Tenacibaculum finnmarkense genomovar finnmarkense]